ncbi:MAG: hypothetical protein R2724_16370 [Bryobacterales bacterium]
MLKAVLSRYVGDQQGLMTGASREGVPRFLLNDIVRYWRTVTVDFVYKQRARGGKERRYATSSFAYLESSCSLLACSIVSWHHRATSTAIRTRGGSSSTSQRVSAGNSVATTCNDCWAIRGSDETAKEVFGAYDEFLDLIDNEERRARLEDLPLANQQSDELFLRAKEIGERFDRGLKQMFFDGPDELKAFTREYGIF